MINVSDESAWVIVEGGKEYYYPKKIWAEAEARGHLERYLKEVEIFTTAKRTKK